MQNKNVKSCIYFSLIFSAFLLSACEKKTTTSDCATQNTNVNAQVEWKMAFPLLPAIELGVNLFQLPNDDNYWYVIRQPGVISQFANKPNADSFKDVLDIKDRVHYSSESGGETGLIGVAVDPQFLNNHYVFVYYTIKTEAKQIKSRLARFTVNADKTFDKSSERIFLEIDRPHANHVAGHLAFDKQGYLYISSGDGGSHHDPEQNGQNLNVLLGKILRIDVNNTSEGKNYAIPPENPFIGKANAREEIWAWGLRNPWRFSFDRLTQDLWAADVGQATWEEINIVSKGGNYGWGDMEGNTCLSTRPDCLMDGKTKPLYVINHDTKACSIIGGYVYRGKKYPTAYGKYFFTDLCDSTMRSIVRTADNNVRAEKYTSLVQDVLDNDNEPHQIASFAEDNQGELFAIGLSAGVGKQIFKMQAVGEKNTSPDTSTASSCANANTSK